MHLFTTVFDHGPLAAWSYLTVTSLHKKGDKLDPVNYRGISVMSVLPKLFATILNARLEAEAATKQLQAYTQAGFRKEARLEDNVLLLITAIEHAH